MAFSVIWGNAYYTRDEFCALSQERSCRSSHYSYWIGGLKSVRRAEEVPINDPQNGCNIRAAGSMPVKETRTLSVLEAKIWPGAQQG